MAASQENRSEQRSRLSTVLAVFSAVWLVSALFVLGLILNPPLNFACTNCPMFGIWHVTFEPAPGEVTFTVLNTGFVDVTIAGFHSGSYYSYNDTVYTNVLLHPQSNVNMTVLFPHAVFRIGRNYTFTVFDSKGFAGDITVERCVNGTSYVLSCK